LVRFSAPIHRVHASVSIASPKLIDFGGQIVQFPVRTNHSISIGKGIALLLGQKAPFDYNILPGTK
jgi:hypothetical protein